jgi:hypothetical protein
MLIKCGHRFFIDPIDVCDLIYIGGC